MGPVAKLNVQRNCRRLIALGRERHRARLATERAVQRLLRGCGCNAETDAEAAPVVLNARMADAGGAGGLPGTSDPPQAQKGGGGGDRELQHNSTLTSGVHRDAADAAAVVPGARGKKVAPLGGEPPVGAEGRAAGKARWRVAGIAARPGRRVGAARQRLAWKPERLASELTRLKGLEAKVQTLTAAMQQEARRPRPIVSVFVTFRCACGHIPPL